MVALRRRVTRKARRFSNRPRLRLHTNKMYEALRQGSVNDARYSRRRWHLLMFHDAPVRAGQREFLADPALSLMKRGMTDVEVLDSLSQGVADKRSLSFFNGSASRISKRILRRFPVMASSDVLLPPSPAIHPSGSKGERLSFALPRSVLVCVRRKQRREVLLALGRGGRNKPPEWNEESYIRC